MFMAGSAVALSAWMVLAANSGNHEIRNPSASHRHACNQPVGSTEDTLAICTRGPWVCPNPECRYRALAGGAPFRSMVQQECSLCRSPLVREGSR
jgi:hypothetical protein